MRPEKNDRAIGTLGIAMKAGKVMSGEFMTERAIREKKARLVLIAADASENTKKKFRDSCTYYHVPIAFVYDKASLGQALGKRERASLAIIDDGLAAKIQNTITGEVNVTWQK